jgi:hypothetical protein
MHMDVNIVTRHAYVRIIPDLCLCCMHVDTCMYTCMHVRMYTPCLYVRILCLNKKKQWIPVYYTSDLPVACMQIYVHMNVYVNMYLILLLHLLFLENFDGIQLVCVYFTSAQTHFPKCPPSNYLPHVYMYVRIHACVHNLF